MLCLMTLFCSCSNGSMSSEGVFCFLVFWLFFPRPSFSAKALAVLVLTLLYSLVSDSEIPLPPALEDLDSRHVPLLPSQGSGLCIPVSTAIIRSVVHMGLEVTGNLSYQPPKHWDCMHSALCLGKVFNTYNLGPLWTWCVLICCVYLVGYRSSSLHEPLKHLTVWCITTFSADMSFDNKWIFHSHGDSFALLSPVWVALSACAGHPPSAWSDPCAVQSSWSPHVGTR